jgi:hypothetical protein
MKIHVINYLASTAAVQIVKIAGFNSDSDIKAPGEGEGQLVVRSVADMASAGEPLLAAVATYLSSAKHAVEPTPEAVWAYWNPAPKSVIERIAAEGADKAPKAPKAPKKKKEETSKKDLTAPEGDGKNVKNGDDAGNPGVTPKGGKMATKKKATKKAVKKAATKKPKSGEPRGEKTAKIKEMLLRKSGVTRVQMTEATGWKTLSFQAMAKSLGLKLTKDKQPGKPTVYHGTAK